MGYKSGDFPITEELSERLLRLPFYYELDIESILYVCHCIREFFMNNVQRKAS